MNPAETCAMMASIVGSRRMHCGDGVDSLPLHRIVDVMQQEQVSIQTVARRMNINELQTQAEMNPACDMKLSDLYRWHAILKVPIAELLREPDAGFSPYVQSRSCLLKMMRTVRTIQQKARSAAIQTMVTQLAEQLTQIMPELKDVHAWPAVGQRRSLDELGKIVENQVPDNIFSYPLTDECWQPVGLPPYPEKLQVSDPSLRILYLDQISGGSLNVKDVIQPIDDEINEQYGLNEKQD